MRILDFGFWTLDFIHPSAFLFFLWLAGVKHHAVAGFQRRFEFNYYGVAQNLFHFAEENATLFAEAGMDELLVVGAAEPAGVEAARKSHFHFVFAICD